MKAITVSRHKGDRITQTVTADRLDTEIAMAAADQAQPSIEYRRGKPIFRYNLNAKQERCGLEGLQGQAVKDITQHLLLKSLPGDCEGVMGSLWTEVYQDGASGNLVAKFEKAEDKLKALARRSGKSPRRFYTLLPATTAHGELEKWAGLKQWFSTLDLVKLTDYSDLETVEYLSDLEQIILKLQNDQTDDKQF